MPVHLSRRLHRLEQIIGAPERCAVCRGDGTWCIVYSHEGEEPDTNVQGCPSCGKANIINVEYVTEDAIRGQGPCQ